MELKAQQYLHSLLPTIHELLEGKEGDLLSQVSSPDYPLKMFYRPQTDSFLYHCHLPLTIQDYLARANDFALHKKLDSNIEDYKVIGEEGGIQLVYLAYRKVLFITPRDFVYLRHCFQDKAQTWIVTVSDDSAQETANHVRAKIVAGVVRVSQIQGGIQVRSYTKTDLKTSLKGEGVQKMGFLQIKKSIDRMFGRERQ